MSDSPLYFIKEILFINVSSSTKDAGDIFNNIRLLKDTYTICNVISLSARIHIMAQLCEETGGVFSLVLNEKNFKELLTVISLV